MSPGTKTVVFIDGPIAGTMRQLPRDWHSYQARDQRPFDVLLGYRDDIPPLAGIVGLARAVCYRFREVCFLGRVMTLAYVAPHVSDEQDWDAALGVLLTDVAREAVAKSPRPAWAPEQEAAT